MQFNVAQLMKEPTGAVRRYELVEDITSLDPELAVLGPLVGTLQIMRINSGVLVTGELSTVVRSNCNRCEEPIAVPVRFNPEENFRPLVEVGTGRYLRPDEFEGEAEDLEDAALLIDEHHILNIAEIVRQNIWLALPMYPACNWEGAGECPNLTALRQAIGDVRLLSSDETGERAAVEAVDPRWSTLLALRNQAGAPTRQKRKK
ncbi:MAG: DUF177 domain-containing protein [Chloroflexota bacterium]|nr:DUF177 domain-containing protein [Chloroflexota bacterium]